MKRSRIPAEVLQSSIRSELRVVKRDRDAQLPLPFPYAQTASESLRLDWTFDGRIDRIAAYLPEE